jgi:hypothetical protein
MASISEDRTAAAEPLDEASYIKNEVFRQGDFVT